MTLKPAIARVAGALRDMGIQPEIIEFAESTRTAAEAAAAVGTGVERIVKSLVFIAGDHPVLILVSGPNRVDTARLGDLLGAPVGRADAAQVRAATGFAIGGVPPIGHATGLRVLLDSDLLQYDTVYAAAGTPHAVFPIAPAELVRITGAHVVTLKVQP